MTEALNIGISQAYCRKLSDASKKYPIETFGKGNGGAANCKRIKQAYRAQKNTKKEPSGQYILTGFIRLNLQ